MMFRAHIGCQTIGHDRFGLYREDDLLIIEKFRIYFDVVVFLIFESSSIHSQVNTSNLFCDERRTITTYLSVIVQLEIYVLDGNICNQ